MSRVCSSQTQRPKMSSKLLILSPAMNVRLDGLNFPMCSGCHQPELRPGTSDQGAGVWTPDITWSLTSSDVSHDHHHCEACSVMVQWLILLSWSVKRRRLWRSHVTWVLYFTAVLQEGGGLCGGTMFTNPLGTCSSVLRLSEHHLIPWASKSLS